MKHPLYNLTCSQDGQVISLHTHKPLSQRVDNDGYNVVSFRYNGKVKTCFVHRLVMECYYHTPELLEEYVEVNHKDRDKQNNTLDNLEYVTPSMNARHRTGHRYEPLQLIPRT